MGRVDIEQVCSSAGRPAGELTRRDLARGLLAVPARDALSSLPTLRRELLAAGRPQSAAFWDGTEQILSAIADGTATYGMVRTWLEATGTEPTQIVGGGFVWPDESERGPVATEMHARLVAHLEGMVAAGEIDPDQLLAGDAAALAAHEQAQVDWLYTELEDGRQPIWAVSDEEDEALLAAWADADADARQLLIELLDGIAPQPRPRTQLHAAARRLREALPTGQWPHDLLRSLLGADPETVPDDEELWLTLATAVVDGGHGPPLDDPLDDEVLAAWMSLQHADWIGAVVTLAAAGPGAVADAETLAHHAATFDFETDPDGDPPPDPATILDTDEPWEWDAWWDEGGYGEELGLSIAFEVVARLWQALGALDDQLRLTDLGWWGLPEALHRAWGGTADATE